MPSTKTENLTCRISAEVKAKLRAPAAFWRTRRSAHRAGMHLATLGAAMTSNSRRVRR
jgi:hypothetical protein